jgi:hypothetical protein
VISDRVGSSIDKDFATHNSHRLAGDASESGLEEALGSPFEEEMCGCVRGIDRRKTRPEMRCKLEANVSGL